jgi:outer membrane receptor for ferrienterochelin and colicins
MNLSKTNHFLIFASLFVSLSFSQSGHYISGKVVDRNNTPLFGANIILKGTFMGSTSDFDGLYRIDNVDPGKYTLMISYIGYKSQEIELYISEFEITDDEEDTESSFSSKLGIDEEDEGDEAVEEVPGILKAPFHENINFSLVEDALETEQVVVSASKKKEKLIDAPITIAVVSEQQIRKTAGGDLGSMLKTVRGVETYQVGMGRTALNVRGFMSAFNGRFVSLVDGANYMEPTFFIAYGNTLPFINEDIERLEVVFGPSSALYGPNAHNGLLNVITKHPKDSQGANVSFGSGSSNYQSFRARLATARGPLSMKFSVENINVLDWKYTRTFGQDYNMDSDLTYQSEHEEVIFWNFFDPSTPEVWDDINGDGQWDYVETIDVMDSEFERKLRNTKANLHFYYELSNNAEISFGHEHYFQSGYQPFDSGLNFIDYTMGSLWSKIIWKNFFGRIHWLRSSGTEYWNSDIAYLNVMRRGLSLEESVDKTKIQDFVQTDVLRGDFQQNFTLKDIDFIVGADFSVYRPESGRDFLNDRGPVSELESVVLADSVMGENIEIEEYGAYVQATLELPFRTKFVTAIRYDKHSYYDARISPRFALQWNGLPGGNIRFSYNRAFQTPSVFNLHMLRFFDAQDSGNILPFIFDSGSFMNMAVNVNDPDVRAQINNGTLNYDDLLFVPMQTQFRGNKDGFIIDEETVIPPLEIETVDSYELGMKKLFAGNLFVDVSLFYSRYENFISPLRVIHDFYPAEDPYIPEQVTHIGDEYISDLNVRNSSVIYSYTSTSGATVYGADLMFKYNLFGSVVLNAGFSIYDNLQFDTGDDVQDVLFEDIELDSIKNDSLRYFLDNSLKSFSFQQGRLFFNAPKNKGFIGLSKDDFLIKNLWAQLTANYTEEFDFVSGYHVATKNPSFTSLSPNSIYDNKGPIGGGWIFDLHLQYKLNDRVRFKVQLNNLLDQDGPRVVGTPPTRRNAIFEVLLDNLK